MGKVTVAKIRESFIEVRSDGKRLGYGDSEYYEPFTDDPGGLFRSLQREHGRCTGNMYQDVWTTSNGRRELSNEPRKVGWVFEKRRKYTDCNEWYLSETWVHVRWGYELEVAA